AGARQTVAQLSQSIEAARSEARQLAKAAIQSFESARDKLLDGVRRQLEQLMTEAQQPLKEMCDTLEAASSTAVTSIQRLFDECASVVSETELQVESAAQQLAAAERSASEMQQQIREQFAEFQRSLGSK